MTKYRAKPQVIDGIRFASKFEAKRYAELQLLERAGAISELKRQVAYPLCVNGIQVCKYIADAEYIENGRIVTEDAKGCKTPTYRLKAKMFCAQYGREIREIINRRKSARKSA